MNFLILPNQLFDPDKYLNKTYTFHLWECPHYFKDYNYNKKKLILHRASMKYYYDLLKSKGYKVSYYEFHDKLNQNLNYTLYNPLNKPEILNLPQHYTIIDTPNLLLNNEYIQQYRKKTNKFFFNAFYMWSKKKLGIIPDLKSQDKQNRKVPKTQLNIKQPFQEISSISSEKYIKEAKIYITKYFKNNYGNIDNFIYPITHQDALKWLDHFIKNKFKNFGPYQDYIDINDNYLNHSLLSSLINIGLLNPREIIDRIPKKGIPINSYEGFIRQLFWREYQYYCYTYYDFKNKNYFNNHKKITKDWYDATTGVIPIDDCIKEGFNSGYLHHIKRLMVVGNYMNLTEILPKEGFRWFMEFSCDSYEWVMHQNVYDMVFCVSGGITMRRPYISSSNYILKMSNYKKANWCLIWDKQYRDFITKNKKKLWKFRYYFKL